LDRALPLLSGRQLARHGGHGLGARGRFLYDRRPRARPDGAPIDHNSGEVVRSDIDIAQSANMLRITDLGRDRLGIADEHLEPYGHYKAKISLSYLDSLKGRPDGKLVLVTAISPTPAGEGKTTTTVGLGDALSTSASGRSCACASHRSDRCLA